MRFYVHVVQEFDGWVAQTESTDDIGRGRTREEAIADLRLALTDRFGHVEAVAPPPTPPSRPSIELVVLA